MDDKILLKLAFFISSLGMALLLFFSYTEEVPLFSLGAVHGGMLDQTVRVQGNVFSVRSYGSVTSLVLEDEQSRLNVVFFEDLDVKKGSVVEVIGTVGLYQDTLQIVGDTLSSRET